MKLILRQWIKSNIFGFIGKGNSREGFVIQQIIALLKPGVSPYFYRTQDGTVLDLVLVKGVQVILGIEIKLSNSPALTKGLTIASKDLGDIPVFVVTLRFRKVIGCCFGFQDFYLGKKIPDKVLRPYFLNRT